MNIKINNTFLNIFRKYRSKDLHGCPSFIASTHRHIGKSLHHFFSSAHRNISTSLHRFFRTSAHLLISTLIVSCAQVVIPGGGPVDKTPPRALKYIPDSASLTFSAKTILIIFDEYILLHDLNTQLIISPPFEHTPEITVKNKTLIIELDKKETLKPNTTYAINFGNALQDYNENNPLGNFKYIFSTGNFIDSMTVKGKVLNAFDLKTEKGILVMLYKNLNDSVVYKSKPDYFAKTNIDGTFQINNIKIGKYKIVALKDVNANYIYDGESESIGFANAEIDVSKKENILVDVFQEPAKRVHLKKYIHEQYGRITLIFNQGSDSIKVSPLNTSLPEDQVILDFSKNKDTLNYWIKNYEKDSLKLLVKNGNKILDTLEFKMIKKEDALTSKKNPLKLKLINSPNGNQNFDLGSELKLVFNNPITSAKKENFIQLKADSVLVSEYKHLDYFYDLSAVKIQWQDTSKHKETNEATVVTPVLFNP
ncbi:MAG: Ig-like domain-containing protein, partial [Bacteroidetes bacterium]|nr:Ig-like domain-containing protein [Bacteroidota bacterium]